MTVLLHHGEKKREGSMMDYQHGGDIYRNQVDLDFSANINPLGLPKGVREAITENMETYGRYPDSRSEALCEALALHHGVSSSQILCANGAADLIFQVVFALKPKKALLFAPGFSEYEQALLAIGCEIIYKDLQEEDGFLPDLSETAVSLSDDLDLVFICNPNNPTGIPLKCKELALFLDRCQSHQIFVVVDECFCDFLEEPEEYSIIPLIKGNPGILVLKAFTKTYAMAGIRLGYGISGSKKLLDAVERVRQPWTVSAVAQAAGQAALLETGYLKEARQLIQSERTFLMQKLKALGFTLYASSANYVFFRDVKQNYDKELYELMKAEKVLIRSCANYRGLDGSYYRICVKTRAENKIFLGILSEILYRRNW